MFGRKSGGQREGAAEPERSRQQDEGCEREFHAETRAERVAPANERLEVEARQVVQAESRQREERGSQSDRSRQPASMAA